MIAQMLARAGLHLATTTVGRMLKERPRPSRPAVNETADSNPKERVVTAKYPGHVFHVDLTVVPTSLGFWCTWLPFALPQCWPFCWWVALVEDHFSRRVMGFAVFQSQPTSEAVRRFLGRTVFREGGVPKYLICDHGAQFWSHGFKAWSRRKGIRLRFGAVGKYGSLAVIERLILTVKLVLGSLPLVPLEADAFRREVRLVLDWYNEHRPYTTLGGRTPNEVYLGRFPANRKPRFEPRSRWQRGSPCARPWALVKGKPGARFELELEFFAARGHLPIVALRRAA